MTIFERFNRIHKMNRMIKTGRTGTPAEFATSLNISQSHLFRCITELQSFGLSIRYSRDLRSYFYSDDKELDASYSLRLISDKMSKSISGGGSLSLIVKNRERKINHTIHNQLNLQVV